MIYIFGDSHAKFNFRDMNIPYVDCHEVSFTMHRIGRDKEFPKLHPSMIHENNVFVFCYGEVDCRCHIGKQVRKGREINEVCNTLVDSYIEAISSVFTKYSKIILCFIPPTMNEEAYHRNIIRDFGPAADNFPFVGDDSERVMITKKVNSLLKTKAGEKGYLFLDCTDVYENEEGTLKVELSDQTVHIRENMPIQYRLKEILSE